jgi:hypothetical protein
MMRDTILAATMASGLILPARAELHLPPRPAIVKPQHLEMSRNLLAMPVTLGMMKRKAAGPLSLTYVSAILSSQSSGSSFTSGSTSFGSTVSTGNTRYLLCLIHNIWGSGGTDGWTNSCTIGGVAATKLFRANAYAGQVTDCWYIENNTLTSGTLAVTWNGTGSQYLKTGFSIWQLVNPASITPTVTTNAASATSITVSVTRSSSQVGLAMASPNNDSGSSISWTNASVKYNILGNSTTRWSAAQFGTQTGTFNVTGTQSATGNVMRVTAAVWS